MNGSVYAMEQDRELITKNDRSKLVSEHNYGDVDTFSMDIPVYATIEYSDDGQIIYEDYTELEKVLDEVVSNFINVSKIDDSFSGEKKIVRIIQGCVLTRLRLSDKEMEYAINYLNDQNILVRGRDGSLDGEFEGYQYLYLKRDNLPKALTKAENNILFKELKLKKEKLKILKQPSKKQLLEKEISVLKNKLIEGNMRLLSSMVRRKIPSWVDTNDIYDIFQIAYEVLIKFVDLYDVDKGSSFSSYLYNYLMFAVWLRYNKTGMFHLSVKFYDLIFKIIEVKNEIENEFYREASSEEIAKRLSVSVQDVDNILDLYNKYNNLESIEELKEKELNFNDNDDDVYLGSLSGNYENSYDKIPEFDVEKQDLHVQLNKILDSLTYNERRVLELRYGLTGYFPLTQAECGLVLGLSGSRIGQIEYSVLNKIRNMEGIDALKIFLEEDNSRYFIENSKNRR